VTRGATRRQALGGESLRSLLRGDRAARSKDWALTQWPRRPSCTTRHGCVDGHDNPYAALPDQAVMGYKLRTSRWAYICWVGFDWGEGADPQGVATRPLWDEVSARELYAHEGDIGDEASRESFEWDNLAHEPEHAALVKQLHTQLVAAVEAGVVKPISGRRA